MSSTRSVTIAPSRAPASRPGPVGGKRDENRQRRTRALGEAALGLFLAHGIEAVTIDDIVDAADTAKGSFYRYFEDKTALVEALVAPVDAAVCTAFATCAESLQNAKGGAALAQPYRALAVSLGAVLFQHPDVIRLYLQEGRTPGTGARAPIARLATHIREGALRLAQVARDEGLVRDIHPGLSATMVQGACEAIAWRVLSGEDLAPVAEIPDAIIGLVLDGMRAPDGPLRARTAHDHVAHAHAHAHGVTHHTHATSSYTQGAPNHAPEPRKDTRGKEGPR